MSLSENTAVVEINEFVYKKCLESEKSVILGICNAFIYGNNCSPKQIINLLTEIQECYDVSYGVATGALFGTLQKGGCCSKESTNVQYHQGGRVFKSRDINGAIKSNCGELTPRRLARVLRDCIFFHALQNDIEGNAYSFIKKRIPDSLEVKDRSLHEHIWCSDFQSENPHCPEYIRLALQRRHKMKFSNTK